MSDLVLGIDLGTTNTVVAALGPDGPVVLRGPGGEALLPSVVAIDANGAFLVGGAAKALLSRDPRAGARAFKRDLATDRRFTFGGREFNPTELSAFVLRAAADRAAAALGRPVDRAVIGVPAWFQEPQRAATQQAAELAGLQCIRLINEPTAAAIAHGSIDPSRERRIAVLDLGGGTFDVTLLEVFEGIIQVVGTAGNAQLGGEDFTDRLCSWAAEQAGVTSDVTAPVYALLRDACEVAKVALTQADAVRLSLPGPEPDRWTPGPSRLVTRAQLGRLCAPLVTQAMGCLADALARASWTPRSVDELVFAGGASRMPVFRDPIVQRFGREPVEGPDPDLVVALGAAIEAGLATHDARVGELVVTDVLAHSLGIEVVRQGKDRMLAGYFLPVLHRNTTLPTRRVERVYAVHPRQASVKVRIFQGDHRLVDENTLLGSFEVRDLPIADADDGACQAIDMSFAHDLNGLLEVEATIASTGKAACLVVEQRAGRLTPEQRETALRLLAALKVHPRDLLPNRILLEEAHTRYARLRPEQRGLLDGPLFAFEEALARQDGEAAAVAATRLRTALVHPYMMDPS